MVRKEHTVYISPGRFKIEPYFFDSGKYYIDTTLQAFATFFYNPKRVVIGSGYIDDLFRRNLKQISLPINLVDILLKKEKRNKIDLGKILIGRTNTTRENDIELIPLFLKHLSTYSQIKGKDLVDMPEFNKNMETISRAHLTIYAKENSLGIGDDGSANGSTLIKKVDDDYAITHLRSPKKLIGPEVSLDYWVAVTFGSDITRLKNDLSGYNFIMLVTPVDPSKHRNY